MTPRGGFRPRASSKRDPAEGRRVGDGVVAAPIVNSGIWEGGDGPGGYGAEINGSGNVLYGYNWQTSGLPDGHYRLTFSLDGVHAPVPLNTAITDRTAIVVSEEEDGGEATATAAQADEGGDQGGGFAEVDGADNLSYIDVQLGDPQYEPYDRPVSRPTVLTRLVSLPGLQSAGQRTRERHRLRLTLHTQRLRNARVRFYGSVLPRHNGKKVRIQRRVENRWRTVTTTTLRTGSRTRSQYSRTVRNARAGSYRVYMLGDRTHSATASTTVRLRLG